MRVDIGKALEFELTNDQIDQILSHEVSKDRVLYIGLRNILMDSHAGAKRDDFETEIEWRSESKLIAERTLANLLNGTALRKNTASRAPKADDFTNFARKHVLSLLSKEKRSELSNMPDKGIAKLDELFARNEAKFRPIVQKALDDAIAMAMAKAEIANDADFEF